MVSKVQGLLTLPGVRATRAGCSAEEGAARTGERTERREMVMARMDCILAVVGGFGCDVESRGGGC